MEVKTEVTADVGKLFRTGIEKWLAATETE
jgi:hypothetical protein